MIYRLNDEFTKIEETEGLLQNRSDDVEFEFVVCKENPQKDSGAILAPSEKYTFAVKEGENVYARSNKMTGALANLAVLNFKKPASGGAGAGCGKMDVLFDGLAATVGSYNFIKSADEYKLLLFSTAGSQAQLLLPVPVPSGCRLIKHVDNQYSININMTTSNTKFEIVHAVMGTGWGFTGIEKVYGIK